MESASSSFRRPSRRTLLRGATLVGLCGVAGVASHSSAARNRSAPVRRTGRTDYPDATWAPAHRDNHTAASRPSSHPIEYVVIHVAQETYANTVAVFQDPASEVSSHYVVSSADGLVSQCVRERDIGWHAGNWDYNTRSIGIEHEGWVDEPVWFTSTMYRASAALTAAICDSYGIPKTRQHVIGHHEVPGATHTDPGALWDWDRYLALVNGA